MRTRPFHKERAYATAASDSRASQSNRLRRWHSPFDTRSTRIEPAGAGGATGASLQQRRHQLGRGGRWRRSRHLRRVQRPRQGGIENGPSRRRVPGGTPFFECSFHEITNEFCSESVQKPAAKKWHKHARTHTDGQTESGRSGASPRTGSGQPKRRYQSQMPPKPSPKRPPDSC